MPSGAGRAFTAFYSQGNTIFKGVHELAALGSLMKSSKKSRAEE